TLGAGCEGPEATTGISAFRIRARPGGFGARQLRMQALAGQAQIRRPGGSIGSHGRSTGRRSEPHMNADSTVPDPRRWFAAAVVIVSVAIPVLGDTIRNVAIPTILREFHAALPSLQWVITGYSLTFATFLIIGGRLGDMYRHRRLFILGAVILRIGSLLPYLV